MAGVRLRGRRLYMPLGGSALYATLMKASRNPAQQTARSTCSDAARMSEEAFAELGLPSGGARVREDPGSPSVVASFHERWCRNETSVALTCMVGGGQVSAAGVPVSCQCRPTGSMAAPRTRPAGGYRRLEDAQLALALVEAPARRAARHPAGAHGTSCGLTVHRFLVQEVKRIDVTCQPHRRPWLSWSLYPRAPGPGWQRMASGSSPLPSVPATTSASPRGRYRTGRTAVGEGRSARARGPRRVDPGRNARCTRRPGSSPVPSWPEPGRAGPAAWIRCPSSPTSSPAPTPTSSWTPNTGPVLAPRRARPDGCCTSWSRRASPGHSRRPGRCSPGWLAPVSTACCGTARETGAAMSPGSAPRHTPSGSSPWAHPRAAAETVQTRPMLACS